MSYMSSCDDASCSKCGNDDAEYRLFSSLEDSKIICHKCGWVEVQIKEWRITNSYYDYDEIYEEED